MEVEMQLALGSAIATRSYSDPELEAAYDRARELCELLGSDLRVAHSLGGLSVFYINRGEILVGPAEDSSLLAPYERHGSRSLNLLDGLVRIEGTAILQSRSGLRIPSERP